MSGLTTVNRNQAIEWLRRWAGRQATLNRVLGALTLLGGLGLLAATWALCYLISLFALGVWVGFLHWAHSVVGLVVIPLLFWGNARASREYLADYSVSTGTATDQVVVIPGQGSNINPLAPDTMHTAVKMMTDCLYVGPRVLQAGIRMIRQSAQFRNMDVTGCGEVLAVLYDANAKLSFQKIVAAVDGMDPTRIFPQMNLIEGVLLLSGEPAGLKLSPELREELRRHARRNPGA